MSRPPPAGHNGSVPPAEAQVLIVDDDRELVSLMESFLSEQGFAVAAAHDGPSGLDAALSGVHDLLLLDVMMPGFDGFELLRRLRGSSDMPVLMLTARTDPRSRVQGLDGGADDYLPKPFDPMELAARIRAILRRYRRLDETAAAQRLRVDTAARRVLLDGRDIDVTGIEFEILDLLARNSGKVVSRDDLMQRLYGREASPFERAIDVHISHLRRKLDAPGIAIRTIRGVGYQLAESSGEGED